MPLVAPVGLLSALPRHLELQRSQYRPAGELRALVDARLAEAVEAARRIPFYATRLGAPGISADRIQELPILSRADIPDLNRSVRGLHRAGMQFPGCRSSGSSGSPIELLFDSRHQAGRFAARARYLRAHGWTPLHRTAWAIGLLPGSPDGDLSRGGRWLLGSRFLSHLDEFEQQAATLRAFDPHFLYTLPSNLDALLRVFEAAGPRRPLPRLRRVLTGGEVLDDSLRARTRETLGVEIADNYGTTEAFLAWECLRGGLHMNIEHVLVEIVDDEGRAVDPGMPGKVLFTTLENRLMPLLRYEIGDYAVACDPHEPCPCGRTLPRIGEIQGRGMNLFRLPGNRLLSPWAVVESLRRIPGVRANQIVQNKPGHFAARYVADVALPAEIEASIRDEILAVVGSDACVTFERVLDIPRTARGKYMSALCTIED